MEKNKEQEKHQLIDRLTAKERMWAQFYAISNNAMQASRKAGYADKTKGIFVATKKNLANSQIMQYVQFLRRDMIQQYQFTTQYCIKSLKQLYTMAVASGNLMQAQSIILSINKISGKSQNMINLGSNGFTIKITGDNQNN